MPKMIPLEYNRTIAFRHLDETLDLAAVRGKVSLPSTIREEINNASELLLRSIDTPRPEYLRVKETLEDLAAKAGSLMTTMETIQNGALHGEDPSLMTILHTLDEALQKGVQRESPLLDATPVFESSFDSVYGQLFALRQMATAKARLVQDIYGGQSGNRRDPDFEWFIIDLLQRYHQAGGNVAANGRDRPDGPCVNFISTILVGMDLPQNLLPKDLGSFVRRVINEAKKRGDLPNSQTRLATGGAIRPK